MAKSTIRGMITSFRRGKRVQHSLNETIVEIGSGTDPATLVGAKASWTGEGAPRMLGRVVGRHGGGSVRVRWRKGFPPQGLGTSVEIERE
jgi:ribosomal protein L35AE/L33A